jgi:hypothetical protein
MTTYAFFDADGVCLAVGQQDMAVSDAAAIEIVPQNTMPGDVWFDGQDVQPTEQSWLDLPRFVDLGEPLETALPANTIAIVNGEKQRGTLSVPVEAVGPVFVELRGAQHGSFVVEVTDYAVRRRQDYPAIADQLDAAWKALAALQQAGVEIGADAEAMLGQVQSVKLAHPKT